MKKKRSLFTTYILRRKLWIVALLALALILASVVGPVAARYITQRRAPINVIDTHLFYFTSDLLGEVSEDRVVSVSAGTGSLSFELRNYADQLRWANMDIGYTVEVSGQNAADVTVTYPEAGDVHTLAADSNASTTAVVTLSGLKNGKSYVVTATSANGYSKTLKATFTVAADPARAYKSLQKHADDGYMVLTVWTEGEARGVVRIDYPDGLIPNETDPAMKGWRTGAEGTDAGSFAGMYASHQYRFFADDQTQITVESFDVTVGTVTATAGNPQS